ncbi:hypothetical protein BJY16_000863 [Actinoplanes octamycinicus]|uniref:G5 domain-containing protein n=1 Tax=Actinoplanes octamycinicus TaxID=135948 RepID=A0A7W7M559_9ACTN|nr:G5 domain-containing protein [Actinoplanes octamycinicus]MBB4737404.1 hypothetical protein [Actinoplanes octamycinicus]GIE60311.1 hypothetical protein Aoc01nite_57130 [Actinoplanes octamycinicus]
MAAGTSALLVLLGGGVAGAAVLVGGDEPAATAEQAIAADPGAARLDEDPEIVSREAAAAEPVPRRHVHVPVQPVPPVSGRQARAAVETGAELTRARAEDPADRTGPRSPRVAKKRAKDRPKAEPVVTTRTDVETRPIPFPTRVVRDETLPRGVRKVQSPGTPGEELVRYLVTLVDGKPSGRRVLDTTVTRQPEQRVVVFGVQRDGSCALNLCVPLGRAGCPEANAPGEPEPASSREPESGPLTVTDEDLSLLDPESLADVRLEPATLC